MIVDRLKIIFCIVLLLTVVILPQPVLAITLTGSGTLNSNGSTYVLGNDISGDLTVTGVNITIDGNGHTLTGDINTASSGGVDGLTIQNIDIIGNIISESVNESLILGILSITEATISGNVLWNGAPADVDSGASDGGEVSIESSRVSGYIYSRGGASFPGTTADDGSGNYYCLFQSRSPGNGGIVNANDVFVGQSIVVTGGDASYNAPTCTDFGSGVTGSYTETDDVDPVVTLTGASSVSYEEGAYVELGATAFDWKYGDFDSDEIAISGAPTVSSPPGTYTVTYSATDDDGNVGTVTRTVNITAIPSGSTPSGVRNFVSDTVSILGPTGAIIMGPQTLIETLDLTEDENDSEDIKKIKQIILKIFDEILKYLAEQIEEILKGLK